MSTLEAVVRDVEAIARGTPARRSRPLRRLTELFVKQAPSLNDDHVSAFDEVIIRLARTVDGRDRTELSRRLADIANAPLAVVRDLAQDADPAVADPILERSSRLSDDDLVAIAEQKGQDHLLALSRRRAVSERVADVLVRRGDRRVVQAIAGNHGARLSEWSLASLVQKAADDGDLRGLLRQRSDLTGEALADTAPTKSVAPQREADAIAEMRRMEAALEKLTATIAGPAPGRDISAALERVAEIAGRKGVQEARVASWIKDGRIDEALAALAQNSGLPAAAVVGAYEAPDHEPLLLMVRAARLSWNSFKLLLTARDGKVPSADLLRTSFESFQQLPVVNVQQLRELLTKRAGMPTSA